MFNAIGIIGLGLIGGSLGLAIKHNKLSKVVIGFDTNKENLNDALKLELIDIGANSYKSFSICDFVIVSVPPSQTAKVILDLFDVLRENTIIIDVASVKEPIIADIKSSIPKGISYIPTHPIAGTENFGPKSAFRQLFDDKYFIITPINEITFAEKKVEEFAKKINMKVKYMDAKRHDEVFAYVSHLPHIIAYNLVNLIWNKKENDEAYSFVGGGFKDFTRIAKSNEKMWSDIFFLNKKNILSAINDYIENLLVLKTIIENNDKEKLLETLKNIRLFKEHLDG
ncbi:MAG TPA: prephenate dehydrogenase/arogenate dehydrogenase family protein [Desulfurella acetivorans]|uniref:prephenate dehydrogenase n=1 Tax=Desulfurella acetivorans TaxID=33002 RepID=A0A7C6E8H8_DESAE|nr:prephenate dehydrogenase/arogenate dehydrogenase family protein [Desulfurella acetivorans]